MEKHRGSLSSTHTGTDDDDDNKLDKALEQVASKPQERGNLNLQLDTGEEYVRFRQRFWQIWYVHLSM